MALLYALLLVFKNLERSVRVLPRVPEVSAAANDEKRRRDAKHSATRPLLLALTVVVIVVLVAVVDACSSM